MLILSFFSSFPNLFFSSFLIFSTWFKNTDGIDYTDAPKNQDLLIFEKQTKLPKQNDFCGQSFFRV